MEAYRSMNKSSTLLALIQQKNKVIKQNQNKNLRLFHNDEKYDQDMKKTQ